MARGWSADMQTRAFRAFMGVAKQMRTEMASALRDHDLTPPQAMALRFLAEADTTPAQLADQVGLTRGTITAIVDRLVELRLVVREPSPEDRRSHALVLTKEGRKAVKDINQGHSAALAAVFTRLTPAEQEQLIALLEKASPPADARPARGP